MEFYRCIHPVGWNQQLSLVDVIFLPKLEFVQHKFANRIIYLEIIANAGHTRQSIETIIYC